MYEPPTLVELGKAHEVILGIASIGYDLDGQTIALEFEFADDCQTE